MTHNKQTNYIHYADYVHALTKILYTSNSPTLNPFLFSQLATQNKVQKIRNIENHCCFMKPAQKLA